MALKHKTRTFYMDNSTFSAMAHLKSVHVIISDEVRKAIKEKAKQLGWIDPEVRMEEVK